MKKLPYGVSDYERIVDNNYYYVDKTPYIEQLENLAEPYIMLLRPRKFGKTLFTSTLENYYDIKKQINLKIYLNKHIYTITKLHKKIAITYYDLIFQG